MAKTQISSKETKSTASAAAAIAHMVRKFNPAKIAVRFNWPIAQAGNGHVAHYQIGTAIAIVWSMCFEKWTSATTLDAKLASLPRQASLDGRWRSIVAHAPYMTNGTKTIAHVAIIKRDEKHGLMYGIFAADSKEAKAHRSI